MEIDASTAGESLIGEFFAATGCARVEAVPTIVHRWRYARAAQPLGADFLYDAELGIGGCGDWCRGDRVEDAFSSGLNLAKLISERG